MGAEQISYGVLGAITATRDEVPVSLGGPQQRRLLAVLLTEPARPVPLDRLVDALWDGEPPEGARRTAMSYVSRLRRVVGESTVAQANGGYRLVAGAHAVDSARFESLVARAVSVPPTEALALLDAALALWRGPAFGEFADRWWAVPEATRLDELRVSALEQRAETLLRVGRIDAAVAELDRLAAEQPTRSTTAGLLARALAADGRDTEAMQAIHRHRQHLLGTAGLDAPAFLTELEQEILEGVAAAAPHAPGYRLGELLGEGAHGRVYRAVQPGLGRDVAVKVVRPDFADDARFVARFEREAQIVSRLEHPHVVPLYDFWREPGGAFLVFRYLDGGTLADDLARTGPWSIERAGRLVEQVGEALRVAHKAGIVHGDVKPSNVLLDREGHAYLGDFGLARLLVGDGGASPVASDPSPYASPESLSGEPVGPQADQYSLAVVLDEVLTGHPSDGPPEPPIRGVLRRATSVDPDARFGSIGEFLSAWRAATGAAPDPLPISADAPNPYVGLRAFEEADAAHFHARRALVDELTAVLDRTRLVLLVGPSGSGKSSVLHAGLVPMLRERGRTVASMVPGDAPTERLTAALLSVATGPVEPDALALAAAIASDHRLTVVIDQFEELWTLNEAAVRQRFVDAVRSLVADAPDVRVVAAIRADLFDRPLAEPSLADLVAAGTVALPALTTADLHEAIAAPAAMAGVRFDPPLEAELVSAVAGRPAALPLLQFTLRELYERRRGGTVPLAAYEDLGGVAGALAAHAEAVFTGLSPGDDRLAERLFLRLLDIDDGGVVASRRLRSSELPAGSAHVVGTLVERRLLIADVDPTSREPTVELAHETLVSAWPRLNAWVADGRDRLRVGRHLRTAAVQWDVAGRAEGDLYSGARLEAALGLDPVDLTELEREFVHASDTRTKRVAQRERRARTRLRRMLAAVSLALALAVLAGAVALVQRRAAQREADAAAVSNLVNLSRSLVSTKRDVAALLALEASLRDPSPSTDGAMMTALYAEPAFVGDLRPPEPFRQMTIAPDGDVLWGNPAEPDHGLYRVDLAGGAATEVPLPFDARGTVQTIIAIDNHRLLVEHVAEGEAPRPEIHLVDVDSGAVTTAQLPGRSSRYVLSPDRTRVAVTTQGTPSMPSDVVVLTVPALTEVGRITQPGPVALPAGYDWWPEAAWVDDATVVVGSTTGRIDLWQPDTGEVVMTINDPADRGVGAVAQRFAVSADGSTLVAGDLSPDLTSALKHGAGLMAFDLATGEPKWPAPQLANPTFAIDERNGAVVALEAGPGSSRLFTYDLATGSRLDTVYDGQHGSIADLSIALDSGRLFAASANEASVSMWSLDGATAAGPVLAGSGWFTAYGLASPDGTAVGAYDPDLKLQLIDVSTGTVLPTADDLTWDSWSWFLADGRLMSVDPGADEVRFDDASLQHHESFTVGVPDGELCMFSTRDGRLLTITDRTDHRVVVVDTAAQRQLWSTTTESPSRCAAPVDGNRLFVGVDAGHLAVFDLHTGEPLATIDGPRTLEPSPDGKLIAGVAVDGTITFWDAATYAHVGEPLQGLTSFADQLAFSPDGRLLFTGSFDNTVRVWDVATRRQIGPGFAYDRDQGSLVVGDGGQLLVSTPHGIRRFSLARERLRAEICRVTRRDLSDAEWRQYVGEGAPSGACATA